MIVKTYAIDIQEEKTDKNVYKNYTVEIEKKSDRENPGKNLNLNDAPWNIPITN